MKKLIRNILLYLLPRIETHYCSIPESSFCKEKYDKFCHWEKKNCICAYKTKI